ncbi:MAG: MerC domain-containing protein [Rhodanobacter sp.]|nr:MAG: MerC domain-containing protein [Rhodanobacter sp.]TAM03980.1 MAG: MerC domain-containing protein [Rhodanobacter sp.]TAM42560.1 MAG: MerC domain-containing protein [Rhodanobacter sp.]TAN26217.1 MAG: MerC domain-containing protein [Rhodanobacter sp.]
MESGQFDKSRRWHVADRIGATASFLCAIHCALLPFVLAALPLVGLEFLADHRFERDFVMFASVLAVIALIRGFRRHQQPLPLLLAVPGLALLLLGVTFAENYSIVLHSVLVTCGGLLLASAHFVNLHRDRQAGASHVHGAQCAL